MSIKRHGVGPRLSAAVVHGNTAYLAGMVAEDPSADTKGQTEQILRKIDATLKAVGSDKSKLLSAQIFITDMRNFADMNSVWNVWVDPEIVCEVRFTEWTEERCLRQPVFLRLREDKSVEVQSG